MLKNSTVQITSFFHNYICGKS